jgi:hypothetical protein
MKIAVFVIVSGILAFISRASLHPPRSHGFHRFFAWEAILALFLLNVEFWFRDPFAWHQLIAWMLLFASFVPLGFGIQALRAHGNPTLQVIVPAHVGHFLQVSFVAGNWSGSRRDHIPDTHRQSGRDRMHKILWACLSGLHEQDQDVHPVPVLRPSHESHAPARTCSARPKSDSPFV